MIRRLLLGMFLYHSRDLRHSLAATIVHSNKSENYTGKVIVLLVKLQVVNEGFLFGCSTRRKLVSTSIFLRGGTNYASTCG